jgi:hypothetical protein
MFKEAKQVGCRSSRLLFKCTGTGSFYGLPKPAAGVREAGHLPQGR